MRKMIIELAGGPGDLDAFSRGNEGVVGNDTRKKYLEIAYLKGKNL